VVLGVVPVQDIPTSNEAFDREEHNRARGAQDKSKNRQRHFFTFSPISTRRRMASALVG
jgi:hypothetical protein